MAKNKKEDLIKKLANDAKFPTRFTHLHVHTQYSLLDGLFPPKEWVRRAVELGFDSLAITDHGTMGGLLDFYIAAKDLNIKPILGIEAYHADNDVAAKDRKNSHITLLAKSNKGFENLLLLNEFANETGMYYKPRIEDSVLERYSSGIIGMSACMGGIIASAYKNRGFKYALKRVNYYKEIFDGDFYIEIMPIDVEGMRELNNVLYKLARKTKTKYVITNDCHYVNKGQHEIQDRILRIISDKFNFESKQFWMKSIGELHKAFKKNTDLKDVVFRNGVRNTSKISKECNVKFSLGKHMLPEYDTSSHTEYESGFSNRDLFNKLIELGWMNKIGGEFPGYSKKPTNELDGNKYIERLTLEVRTITDANFIDYFLIVEDLIRWAKFNNIAVGPARGSVAGSLAAFVLDITVIDPIKHKLLFERFLNPVRVSGERAESADALPDCDLDFESLKREEIIDYIRERYGTENVCSIGTYGKLHLKGLLKDFLRVEKYELDGYKYDWVYINKMTRLMDGDLTDIENVCEKYPDFKTFYDRHKKWFKKIVEPALGQIKFKGKHTAGVLIAPKEISSLIPIRSQKNKDGTREVVSEWEDWCCERRGLLKLDVLGLKQLDVNKYACELIKKRKKVILDIYGVPLDDVETLKRFASGETEGVFQFNSGLQKHYMKTLLPESFDDLVASNALLRPGPMDAGAHEKYIELRHGEEDPEYDHEDLKEILKDSRGLYIFQEGVMSAVHILGGFTLAEADIVRTVIKKKDEAKMSKFEKKFIKGATEKGLDEEHAKEVWEKLKAFSGYGFNKSHSTAYALLAFCCQYLKVHYKHEFWTATLQFASDSFSKRENLYTLRGKAIEDGMDFMLPDINKSKSKFLLTNKNRISWPLSAIKGIGELTSDEIVEKRPYKSFKDFFTRSNKRRVNKKVMLALIKSKSFKKFGSRDEMIREYFSLRKEEIPDEYNYTDKKFWRKCFKEALGFLEKTKENIYGNYLDMKKLDQNLNNFVEIVGQVYSRSKIFKDKKGREMMFLNISDIQGGTYKCAIAVWSDFFETYKGSGNKIPKIDDVIKVGGLVKTDRDGIGYQLSLNDDGMSFIKIVG